jgi:hypothetical protein
MTDNNNYSRNSKYANSIEAEKVVPLYKRIGSELIGTFALVFAAAGSDISDALGGHVLGKFAVAGTFPAVLLVPTKTLLDLRLIHSLLGAIFRIIGMHSQWRNGDLHPDMKGHRSEDFTKLFLAGGPE